MIIRSLLSGPTLIIVVQGPVVSIVHLQTRSHLDWLRARQFDFRKVKDRHYTSLCGDTYQSFTYATRRPRQIEGSQHIRRHLLSMPRLVSHP
jgi:hypothetical protein